MKNSTPKTKTMKPRNPVVRGVNKAPKRNAGRHGDKRKRVEEKFQDRMIGEVRAIDALKTVLDKRPWEGEPNYIRFKTTHGYWAEVKRHPVLYHLCGYLHVPNSHPVYDWNDEKIEHVLSAYGGITYTKRTEGKLVLGFDCAHADDFVPGVFASLLALRVKAQDNTDSLYDTMKPEDYKTVQFVKEKLESLGMQVEAELERLIFDLAKQALREGMSFAEVWERLQKKGA